MKRSEFARLSALLAVVSVILICAGCSDNIGNGTQTLPNTSQETKETELFVWNFFYDRLGNTYGVAALMGNLFAESNLRSNNLQNGYEKKLGYTDKTYTEAVDSGEYTNFVKDSAGYGIAQWTFWSRKEALLNYAKSQGKSISDLQMQCEFLWSELQSYTSVINALKNATDVESASTVFLKDFERPASSDEAVQKKRAGYAEAFLEKYDAVEVSE